MVFSNKILFSVVITAVINCGYCTHEHEVATPLVFVKTNSKFLESKSIDIAAENGGYSIVSRKDVEEYFRSNIGKYDFDLTGPNHISLCITLIKDCPDLIGHILDEEMKDESIDAFKGCSHLMYACMIGDDEGVELLIQRGANVNKPSFFGATPLLAACQRNNAKIVDLLLNAGACPHCEIESPIMVACGKNTFGGANVDMALSLFRHGADLFKVGHARPAFSYLTEENQEKFLSLLTHKEIEWFMPDYKDFQAAKIVLEEAMEKLYA